MNVGKLLETVNSLVPLNNAFEDDFVGLTVGSEDSEVNGVAVAHELENSILDYSTNKNINTLITYHPPPLKKILNDDGTETCLLYTSPSPRDISGSRMPSSA